MSDAMVSMTTPNGFQFSAVPIDDNLDSTEYAIGEILIDASGSISGREKEIEKCLKDTLKLCKKLPTCDNLMLRLSQFGSQFRQGVEEIHGTRLVNNIQETEYDGVSKPGGMTPLRDALGYGIEAAYTYGKGLVAQDYICSAVIYIITDGGENASHRFTTGQQIKDLIAKIKKSEDGLSSVTTILIGVGIADKSCEKMLTDFKDDCGMDAFIPFKDMTPSSLGKVAGLISQSLSSASTQIASQNTSTTIAAATNNIII